MDTLNTINIHYIIIYLWFNWFYGVNGFTALNGVKSMVKFMVKSIVKSMVKSTPMLVKIQQYIYRKSKGFSWIYWRHMIRHTQNHNTPVYMSISHENIPMIYPLYHHLLCLNQHVFFCPHICGKTLEVLLFAAALLRGAPFAAHPLCGRKVGWWISARDRGIRQVGGLISMDP